MIVCGAGRACVQLHVPKYVPKIPRNDFHRFDRRFVQYELLIILRTVRISSEWNHLEVLMHAYIRNVLECILFVFGMLSRNGKWKLFELSSICVHCDSRSAHGAAYQCRLQVSPTNYFANIFSPKYRVSMEVNGEREPVTM